ncbi:MAG: hypothetical protein DMF58_08885 [Acidobacteria bacterium]|nr:MAG: hypothetical protein DMF58_08885 [Acidobacteriota bacterium]
MDEKERQSAFLSALTTEHFVLQTAASATVNESAARASIYVMSLSTSVVAMGFASQSRDAFGPFAASVLPALYLLGVFTVIRLVDVNGEYMLYLARIARIRSYYRALIPDDAEFFGPENRHSIPSLQLGRSIAFLTTSSSMVAFINNIVAGAGIALLARWILGAQRTMIAVLIGIGVAAALMAAFLAYQRWRFSMFEPVVPASRRGDAETKGE